MASNTTWNAAKLAVISAMMANFMALLCRYFKPAKLARCFTPTHVFFPNKMLQTCLANRLPKRFQLVLGAFGHQFDPAIGQVAHRAGDLETAGDRFCRITKPDALHSASVPNLHSLAIRSTHRRQSATSRPFTGGKSASTRSDSGIKPYPRWWAQSFFAQQLLPGRPSAVPPERGPV